MLAAIIIAWLSASDYSCHEKAFTRANRFVKMSFTETAAAALNFGQQRLIKAHHAAFAKYYSIISKKKICNSDI